MLRSVVTHGLSLALTLALLFQLDAWLSEDRAPKGEREIVQRARASVDRLPQARAITLGCSTRISSSVVAEVAGVPAAEVVDAHMGGCHQDCSWAQVRGLLDEGKHYDVAFYALNQALMCENQHSKRTLQQRMWLPLRDLPAAAWLYRSSDHGLRYLGRYLGASVSGAYEDTGRARRRLAVELPLFANPRHKQASWFSPENRPKVPWEPTCRLEEESPYKVAVTRALMEDLTRLADRVYFVVLPDKSLHQESLHEPGYVERWARFRDLMKELADGLPGLTLVDLSVTGPRDPRDYRDGLHLKKPGLKKLRAALLDAIGTSAP